MEQQIRCKNCSAPISYEDIRSGVAFCPHCGCTFSISDERAFLIPFGNQSDDEMLKKVKIQIASCGTEEYWSEYTHFGPLERVYVPYLWCSGLLLTQDWKEQRFTMAIPLSKDVVWNFPDFARICERRKLFSPEFLAGSMVLPVDYSSGDLESLPGSQFPEQFPKSILKTMDPETHIIYLPVFRQWVEINNERETLFIAEGVSGKPLFPFPKHRTTFSLSTAEKNKLDGSSVPMIIGFTGFYGSLGLSIILWIIFNWTTAKWTFLIGMALMAVGYLVWYIYSSSYGRGYMRREKKRQDAWDAFLRDRMGKLKF